MNCYLDRPSTIEYVPTTLGVLTKHRVYCAGVHQACKLVMCGTSLDNHPVKVVVTTLTRGHLGTWLLPPERNKAIITVSFFIDDSVTCEFYENDSLVQTNLILVKIVSGGSLNQTELLMSDADWAREYRMAGLKPDTSPKDISDELGPGYYIKY